MIRLTTYAVLLVAVAFLAREAALWAWSAYKSPAGLSASAPSASPGAEAMNHGAPSAKLAQLQQRPLSAYPQTVSRPLFFPGRRYPDKEVKKPVRVVPDRVLPPVNVRDLKLLGVRLGTGVSQALIGIGNQTPAWVNVGDNVMTWTVTSVNANNAVVEHEGQKADLKLYE